MTAALWLALALATHAPTGCRFRPPLDDAEASRLVMQTPAARKATHGLDVQASSPPNAHAFSGVLVSRTPADGALDNGLLGYFTVDRRTGEVTTQADFSTVHGRELARARAALCRSRGAR